MVSQKGHVAIVSGDVHCDISDALANIDIAENATVLVTRQMVAGLV